MEPQATLGTVRSGEGTPAPGATVTAHQAAAEVVLKSLAETVSLIPKLTEAHPATLDFIRGKQSIPLRFIETVIASVETCPELQRIGIMDPVAARDDLQFLEAFRTMYDRVAAFQEQLKVTLDARRASLAFDSLKVYQQAKGLAGHPSFVNVGPYSENMRRDLGRRGNKPSEAVKRALAKAAQGVTAADGTKPVPVVKAGDATKPQKAVQP